MSMPGVTLGVANGVTITTSKLSAGVFDSIGRSGGSPYYSITQIELTHSYARAVPAGSGFPRVVTQRPSIDDLMSENGGTIPSSSTCFAFTVEAAPLIAAGAATATGIYF
jgi:hypothetical protein